MFSSLFIFILQKNHHLLYKKILKKFFEIVRKGNQKKHNFVLF